MKKYVLSSTLLLIEIVIFSALCHLLEFEDTEILKLTLGMIAFLFIFGHYEVVAKLVWDEMKAVFKAISCFFIITFIFICNSQNGADLFLKLLALSISMYVISIMLDRTLRIIFRKFLARRTLIIGCGADADRLGRITNNNRFALTNVVAYIRYGHEEINPDLITRYEENLNTRRSFHLYEFEEIEEVLNKEKIDQVVLAVPFIKRKELNELLLTLYDKVGIIKYMPDVDAVMTFNTKIQDFDGMLLISTAQGKIGVFARMIKRIIDIIAAIAGILLLIPLTLIVRRKNHKNGDFDPIFFKQERLGYNGKPITIYKYRTMIPNAEKVLEELMEKDPAIREEYLTNKKLVSDPRITEAGKFLRKSSLDEFPQFINVLKGEMSLVGPRPYLFREIDDMGIYYNSVIRCKPGITGMWQANGRSDVGFADRCKLDDYYYRNWTIGLDMIIIYKTIRGVIYGKGAL